MSRSRLALLGFTILLLTPAVLHACMWDYDTLKMERARFPSTLELITGKFLRHSPEFYQWRVEDRLRRLESEPDNFALYDDLAVAYSKLGQQDKAIETILIKEQKKPGEYTTYANLGTFYIFAGEWEKSLTYINKALAINHDAHFGREKYQKHLVEYVLSLRGTTRFPAAAVGISFLVAQPPRDSLPLPLGTGPKTYPQRNFYHFLSEKDPTAKTLEGRQAAVTGILGMMKFAYHDSPILLEALGDVLGSMNDVRDAKQLAARAYLKAEMHVTDRFAKHDYHSLVSAVLEMQMGFDGAGDKVSQLEASFKVELNDAEQWYAKLHDDECRWIREGKNPEAEFDKLYTSEPALQSPDDNKSIQTLGERLIWIAAIAFSVLTVVFASAVGLLIVVIRRYRRKHAPAAGDERSDKSINLTSTAIHD